MRASRRTKEKRGFKGAEGNGLNGQKHGGREGVCTGALLPNNAKSAGNSLVVGKDRGGRKYNHIVQTVHRAHPVVCVRVAVNDANEDARHAHRKLLCVGLGVFPKNKATDGSNGLVAAMRGYAGLWSGVKGF